MLASASGRIIAKRWATAEVSRYRAKRIYEGTDRFFNYCINGGKRIRSKRLRHYCVEPGSTYRSVTFSRTR